MLIINNLINISELLDTREISLLRLKEQIPFFFQFDFIEQFFFVQNLGYYELRSFLSKSRKKLQKKLATAGPKK